MKKEKMADKYMPKEFEDKLYEEWEKKGQFKPSQDKSKEAYCIMMPPPNVTGKLHGSWKQNEKICNTHFNTGSSTVRLRFTKRRQ